MRKRREHLSNALRQHRAARNAERNIGAQCQSHFHELFLCQSRLIQIVEQYQHCRRIRAAARQTCSNRIVLFDVNTNAVRLLVGALQKQLCGAIRQIAAVRRQITM